MSKGRIKKDECRLINLWFPETLLPEVEQAVRKMDSDRSKFIRIAVREKLDRDLATKESKP